MNDQSAISEIRPLLEAEGLTGFLRQLTFFICVCTLFEGYDTLIVSLALPYLGRDFLSPSPSPSSGHAGIKRRAQL